MRISRSTGVFSGLWLVILGAWGALIPFIGPYFNYAFGGDTTWHFTTERLWLDVLPGVLVVIGALIMLRSGHRVSGVSGSWMAIIGGAWFVVGPAVSLLWHHGAGPIGAPYGGSTRRMLEEIGYFYGLGAMIVALASFGLARFVSRPALVVEPITVPPGSTLGTRPAPGEPAAAEPVAAQTVAAEPVPAQTVAAEPVAAQAVAAQPVAAEPVAAPPLTAEPAAPAPMAPPPLTAESAAADAEATGLPNRGPAPRRRRGVTRRRSSSSPSDSTAPRH